MSEERDSQLSAMYDGELSAAECELLARRLAREPKLRAQWGRYALIGTVLRGERGVRLDSPVASRVASALADEPAHGAGDGESRAYGLARTTPRWLRPLVGAGIAASVAALALLTLRAQNENLNGNGSPDVSQTVAQNAAQRDPVTTATLAASAPAASLTGEAGAAVNALASTRSMGGEPDSYVVPTPSRGSGVVGIPAAQLANYVVAHSEYSSPIGRRTLLSALVASEAGAEEGAAAATDQPQTAEGASDANPAR